VPRIVRTVNGLFVPGWGANAALYAAAMPDGWEALEPPSFRSTRGDPAATRRWMIEECGARQGPFALGGHSFGAALALFAALDERIEVERLVLVNPVMLPLAKPVGLMLFDFYRRAAAGWFPRGEASRRIREVAFHPVAARRLGNDVRRHDLTPELGALRERRIPAVVVGTTTDTLVTPAQCRRISELLGAEYREVGADGGHLWFLRRPDLLAAELRGRGPV
jgi:pimeloyl-ACP methyl ester carboxylesterase